MKNIGETKTIVAARYSPEFHLAMSSLSKRGIDMDLAGQALQLWHLFCVGMNPPEPIVEGTQEGGLRFAWSSHNAYLDAEIYKDGSVEWFFKDRTTGQIDGTAEERDSELPAQFFDRLRTLSGVK